MASYIPKKGDFVVLTFDSQSGHEQKGRRPALIVSNDLFNKATGLTMACPVTNTRRDIPFHVPIPPGISLTGFVMIEQVKSVDFSSRKVTYIEKAPGELLNEVLAILDACLF